MKSFALYFICLALTLSARSDETPKIIGQGEWGPATDGVCCRVTTDKTQYQIGEQVYVLVEVKNVTNQPVALGIEPLLEINNGTNRPSHLFRQQAEIELCFFQGSPGFFCTYYLAFPHGTKSEARAVLVGSGEIYSEIVATTPWGPTYSSSPSIAQPGTMDLKASILQFITSNLKKHQVQAAPIRITIKSKN